MSKITTITASNGITFTVRLVEENDHYGLYMGLIHNQTRLSLSASKYVEPMVEFYDTRSQFHYDFVGDPKAAKAAGATCLGQFVSRYYLGTLLKHVESGRVLHLDGRVEAWRIDRGSLCQALQALGVWSHLEQEKTPAEQKAVPCDAHIKLVVVYDSANPDSEPEVWLPGSDAHRYELVLLDKSQELGGGFPNTDPADILLLESACHPKYSGYEQVV